MGGDVGGRGGTNGGGGTTTGGRGGAAIGGTSGAGGVGGTAGSGGRGGTTGTGGTTTTGGTTGTGGTAGADQCKAFGWATRTGRTGGAFNVTGGGSAAPNVVTTFAQLQQYASDGQARVIHIDGTLGNGWSGNSGDRLEIKSNKTIVGLRAGTQLKAAIHINAASNVILRNIVVRGPGFERGSGVGQHQHRGELEEHLGGSLRILGRPGRQRRRRERPRRRHVLVVHLRLRARRTSAQPVQPDRLVGQRA